MEQTDETPDISIAEKIVEGPVTQTQGKTQQVLNTRVQHVVDTVKTVEVPLLQFTDKVVDILVVALRQIPKLQHAEQVVDVPAVLVAQVPLVQVVDRTAEIPQLLSDVQVPHMQVEDRTAEHSCCRTCRFHRCTSRWRQFEIPHLPLVEKIVMIPEIQMVQGPQTSESLSGETTVAGKIDHETVVRGVAQNIQIVSFMDDFSSVDSEGLNHQDCEVPSHVGKQSGSTHQQHTPGQTEIEEEREKSEKERERESQGEGVQGGNGKEQEREKKEKGEEEEEKVDQVDENVMGWRLATRSRKQRKRVVQIFVKVDDMKMVAMEVLSEDKSPEDPEHCEWK